MVQCKHKAVKYVCSRCGESFCEECILKNTEKLVKAWVKEQEKIYGKGKMTTFASAFNNDGLGFCPACCPDYEQQQRLAPNSLTISISNKE